MLFKALRPISSLNRLLNNGVTRNSAGRQLTSSASLSLQSPSLVTYFCVPIAEPLTVSTNQFSVKMTGEEVTKRKVQDLPSVDCEAPLEMSAKRLKSEPIESDLDEDSKKLEQFAEIPSNGTATTSTDEMTVTIKSDSKPSDSTNNEAEFARKFRPKKLAILVSYSGVGYFGLQRNIPYKTIEEEILKVWLQMGLILPEHYERPQQLYFQRAARTDKGVSAAKQILTCRLPEQFLNRMDEMNRLLPDDIRIFGAKRTTKFFDSRTYCDARTYSYMLPTFALAPPDQLVSTYYRVQSSLIDEFNRVLQLYKGTHNFHNFTSGKKATDASAMRFMIEISCGQPFMMDEMEFALVRIKGQSFMLHQIRKMIGLAVAVMRGNANEETIERAFKEDKIDIPIAPGLGLMLEEVHYDRYNMRYGGDGIHEPIVWPELNDQVEDFKRRAILPNVYQGEKKEFSMVKWLQSLPIHTYGVREQDKTSEQHQNQIKEAKIQTDRLIEKELQLQAQQQETRTQETRLSEYKENEKCDTSNEIESAPEVNPETAYRKAYVNADLFEKKKEVIPESDD